MRRLSIIIVLLAAGLVGGIYLVNNPDLLSGNNAEDSTDPTRIEESVADPAPQGENLPARPFDPAVIAELERQLQSLADTQDRSGFVAVLARDGEIQHEIAVGYADVENERAMSTDTLVRIASMTKPVTAVAALILIEDGSLSLDDPVSDYIPDFADMRVATSYTRNEEFEIPTEALDRPITIRDLMLHTAGLGYLFDFESNLGALYIGNSLYAHDDLETGIAKIAELPLYHQPGESWVYGWESDVLGYVIEQVSGQDLDSFLQQEVFGPLGMNDTGFYISQDDLARTAVLYTHDDTGSLVPVSPEDDLILSSPYASGGAGLVSTADDFMKFALMLANGGILGETRILSEASIEAMTSVQVDAEQLPESMTSDNIGFGYGIGVQYADRDNGRGLAGDFGWPGYFDTQFIVSPTTGVVALIMAQEERGATTPDTVGARDVFEAFVYEAVADRTG